MKKTSRGVTLIELMIVVAVVGMLAMFSFPSFQESLAKSRRSDATGVLMEASQFMERQYASSQAYVNSSNTTLATADLTAAGLGVIPKGATGNSVTYNVSVSVTSSNQAFTLTATRTGSMASDECGDFTLTNTGSRSIINNASSRSSSTCWRK